MKPQYISKNLSNILRKALCSLMAFCFLATSIQTPAYAQASSNMPWMPKPGVMVHLSPDFKPAHLLGITINPKNALQFDFIMHQGDNPLSETQKQEEYKKVIKYFLASLTISDDDQWVNLSPYEKNRVIQDSFGLTEMGRDLLAQDYILKQITSSLIYPEDELGKRFWDKVYERAWKEFGTTDVPVNTFNKVWIVPDTAVVYESVNTAYVLRSRLKVMLEEDYLSLNKHSAIQVAGKPNKTHTMASQIVKEIVLPELEKEVNEGQNFANLRQIYSGMVLATWYKKALKDSLLAKVYANQGKVNGVNQKDPQANQAIYQQYLKAFKKGVFNYIKEDVDKYSQQAIPRKYFSGGFTRARDTAMIVVGPGLSGVEVSQVTANREVSSEVFGYLEEGHLRKMELGDAVEVAKVDPTSVDVVGVELETLAEAEGLVEPQVPVEAASVEEKPAPAEATSEVSMTKEEARDFVRALLKDNKGKVKPEDLEALLKVAGVDISIEAGSIIDGLVRRGADEEFPIILDSAGSQIQRAVQRFDLENRIKYLSALKVLVYKGHSIYFINTANMSSTQEGERVEAQPVLTPAPVAPATGAQPASPKVLTRGVMNQSTAIESQQSNYLGALLSQVPWLVVNYKPTIKYAESRPVRNLEFRDFRVDGPLSRGNSADQTSASAILKGEVQGSGIMVDKFMGDIRKYDLGDFNKRKRGVVALYVTPFTRTTGVIRKKEQMIYTVDLFMQIPSKVPHVDKDRNALIHIAFSMSEIEFNQFKSYISESPQILLDAFKNSPNEELRSIYVGMIQPALTENGQNGFYGPVQLQEESIIENLLNPTELATIIKDDADLAMAGQENQLDRVGGIDLNAANLDLQIKRDGQGVPLPLDMQDMNQLMKIPGFVPVIIEIKPAAGLPIYSELQQQFKLSAIVKTSPKKA